MKRIPILLIAFVLFPVGLIAQISATGNSASAQSVGNWNRVLNLDRGERIFVTTMRNRTFPCEFGGATSSLLFCEMSAPLGGSAELQFDRASVKQIRLNRRAHTVKVVIGVFATAGAILGATRIAHNGSRLIGGYAGSAVGGLVGLAASMPAAILVRGKLIYRARPSTATPLANEPPNPISK